MEEPAVVVEEFRRQLAKGMIQKGYRMVFDVLSLVRISLESKGAELSVSKNIYHGYLDMSYFAVTARSLDARKLKVAVVFNYGSFRFEIWLSAANKAIQKKYWTWFDTAGYSVHPRVPDIEGQDSILEKHLERDMDFNDPAALADMIAAETIGFIGDIEGFLERND